MLDCKENVIYDLLDCTTKLYAISKARVLVYYHFVLSHMLFVYCLFTCHLQVDQQPVKENNVAAYMFFIVFIISGSFFILNLFIGVIIDNFNQLKQQVNNLTLFVVCTSLQLN